MAEICANKDTEYKRLGSIINDARLAGNSHWETPGDTARTLDAGSRTVEFCCRVSGDDSMKRLRRFFAKLRRRWHTIGTPAEMRCHLCGLYNPAFSEFPVCASCTADRLGTRFGVNANGDTAFRD